MTYNEVTQYQEWTTPVLKMSEKWRDEKRKAFIIRLMARYNSRYNTEAFALKREWLIFKICGLGLLLMAKSDRQEAYGLINFLKKCFNYFTIFPKPHSPDLNLSFFRANEFYSNKIIMKLTALWSYHRLPIRFASFVHFVCVQ